MTNLLRVTPVHIGIKTAFSSNFLLGPTGSASWCTHLVNKDIMGLCLSFIFHDGYPEIYIVTCFGSHIPGINDWKLSLAFKIMAYSAFHTPPGSKMYHSNTKGNQLSNMQLSGQIKQIKLSDILAIYENILCTAALHTVWHCINFNPILLSQTNIKNIYFKR